MGAGDRHGFHGRNLAALNVLNISGRRNYPFGYFQRGNPSTQNLTITIAIVALAEFRTIESKAGFPAVMFHLVTENRSAKPQKAAIWTRLSVWSKIMRAMAASMKKQSAWYHSPIPLTDHPLAMRELRLRNQRLGTL